MIDCFNSVWINIPITLFTFQEHNSFEIEGSFLIEKSLNKNLLVTLTVDDEDKIEFFEVKTPSGKRKMFPTYLDR